MKQITLQIPENKYSFFLELVKSLDFVKVKETGDLIDSPYDPEFVEMILQGEKDIAEGKGIKMSSDQFKTLCK
jgi:hypothetical protein